jgi:hypothetical protein
MIIYLPYLQEAAQIAGTSSWLDIMPTRNLPKRNQERSQIVKGADIYATVKQMSQ